MRSYLDFEKPVAELEAKVAELRALGTTDNAVSVEEEINRLEAKAGQALKALYAELTPWQKTQVARHPQRPHCLDYVKGLLTEFVPLAGDRKFGDDEAIIGEDVEQPVGNVFHTGQVLLYEYDFGSTTRLEIKVLGEYPLNLKDDIVLMSRNEALHILCDNCGKKPAVQLCIIHYADEPKFFCTACGKKHAKTCPDFEDYSAFPVVNSPRMGVCGYMGSEIIDTERDKAWNGK